MFVGGKGSRQEVLCAKETRHCQISRALVKGFGRIELLQTAFD